MGRKGEGKRRVYNQRDITSPLASKNDINNFWKTVGENHNKPIFSQEDAADILSAKEVADTIKEAYDDTTRMLNESIWKQNIATQSEIREDATVLIETDGLSLINSRYAHALSIRAIPGHAQNGHSTFREIKKSNSELPKEEYIRGIRTNTDMDTVLRALEGSNIDGIRDLTFEGFKNKSQRTIDDIVYFVEGYFRDILKNPLKQIQSPLKKALKRDGSPLGGLEFFKDQKIHVLEFMRGFYFASLMDNHDEIRSQVNKSYRYEMGGGDTFPMNRNVLMEYGINLTQLSKKEPSGLLKILHSMDNKKGIELLTQLGIIEKQKVNTEEINPLRQNWDSLKSEYAIDLIANPHLRNQYIRYKKGLGCSDDIAILLSSFLPKTYSKAEEKNSEISRFLGALMADKIDTIEKDARLLFPGGQDEFVGEYFNRMFQAACRTNKKFREKFNINKRLNDQYTLVPKSVIVDYTAASANTEDAQIHSSQRWLYKTIEGTCALQQYIKQMYSTMRHLGRDTPSDREITRIYDVVMKTKTPSIDLTFSRIPLEHITETFRKRHRLIQNSSHREGNLMKFYLDN